jgi:hypothetical protein
VIEAIGRAKPAPTLLYLFFKDHQSRGSGSKFNSVAGRRLSLISKLNLNRRSATVVVYALIVPALMVFE